MFQSVPKSVNDHADGESLDNAREYGLVRRVYVDGCAWYLNQQVAHAHGDDVRHAHARDHVSYPGAYAHAHDAH